jgi:hypothetical protein
MQTTVSPTELMYNYGMESSGWNAQFAFEIGRGLAARTAGNEGQARVCARRAAGAAIGEYLQHQGLPQPGPSAYYRLQYLRDLPGISFEIRNICDHLLIRVDEGFALPIPNDLLTEAFRLAQGLGLNPENPFV